VNVPNRKENGSSSELLPVDEVDENELLNFNALIDAYNPHNQENSVQETEEEDIPVAARIEIVPVVTVSEMVPVSHVTEMVPVDPYINENGTNIFANIYRM
jgi:hypothetical protein